MTDISVFALRAAINRLSRDAGSNRPGDLYRVETPSMLRSVQMREHQLNPNGAMWLFTFRYEIAVKSIDGSELYDWALINAEKINYV